MSEASSVRNVPRQSRIISRGKNGIECLLVETGEKVPRRAFDLTEENNNNVEIQVHRR
jgi:hypothetical protein